ncbi:MAG: hypothetical protein JOZ69_07560 [Myxococcales bacterium]|nr:hypothetical protein [Myxococcales bacterium]
MRFARCPGSAAVLVAGLAVAGCAVHAYPPAVGGYATVYADDVPPNIETYPRVSYEGGYAYLVNDRWYYPTSSGWVVLREEPRELYRYRADYGRRARPGYYPRQSAPPAQYGYPPPAVRVR